MPRLKDNSATYEGKRLTETPVADDRSSTNAWNSPSLRPTKVQTPPRLAPESSLPTRMYRPDLMLGRLATRERASFP